MILFSTDQTFQQNTGRPQSRVAISLTGTREAASSAKKIIQDLSKKGYSVTLSESDGENFKEHTSR